MERPERTAVPAEPSADQLTEPPTARWQDVTLPAAERARALADAMTVEEKLAQLVGIWVGADAAGGDVAPHQADMTGNIPAFEDVIRHGLGQLTRPYGTAPVEPHLGARSLARSQAQVMAASRFGIPAQVHEECLAGFAAWKATAYPVPPSWGATFDPALIERMAAGFGATMRAAGVHQGLAPVLDVARDHRWGRVEETISEDPYLVGTVGTAYVRGLESTGVVATLKHFVGYSASRSGRNLAPVSAGPREVADVLLPPFEMALRDGGARSVMHSYSDIDGVPSAADARLLTGLLREEWGFAGTVVADYYGIAFLQKLHGIAADRGQAAALALEAGVDVELPNPDTYGAPLLELIRSGRFPEELVDRALLRVLQQKAELGLLAPEPGVTDAPDTLVLDDAESDALALDIARRAVVLLDNPTGVLPLAAPSRLAVVGPLAEEPMGMLGCYSFPAHVGVRHPEHELGLDITSVLTEIRQRFADVQYAPGSDIAGDSTDGFAEAVAAARDAEVAVVVLGDQAGLFGRGTSGEGCDATDLNLPGVQGDLARAVLDTGTPTVLVLLTGRPYALGALADDAAAVVQAFFPGQRGGQAIAELIAGEIEPAGRLPLSVPADPSGQPNTYLAAPLARRSGVSNVDPSARYAFGHGLAYGSTTWGPVSTRGTAADGDAHTWAVDGEVEIEVEVRNDSDRTVPEVVQLYLHRPVAQVVQPVVRLVGYARVDLAPGEARRVRLTVHADLTSFTGLAGHRVVQPGPVQLQVARSSADAHEAVDLELVGSERAVGHDRRMQTEVTVLRAAEEGR